MTLIHDLHRMHVPDGYMQPMVYSVWEDGEVTLEKGGDLFGRRNLHCIIPGNPKPIIRPDSLPVRNSDGSHSRIYVNTHEEAIAAHSLLWPESPYKEQS